jgi:Poly-gamma-glutamate hydrolase
MSDKYPSMTALYADPSNVEGITYGKRWRRHEWIQLVEAQATDNPEAQKIVLAIHGGGIEGGTSEVALVVRPVQVIPI